MGGGKGAAPTDNSMALYQQQQADLARQKAEQEQKEKEQAEAERAKRDALRQQMLGESVKTEDDEDAAITQNVLS